MQERQICFKRYGYIICGYLLVFALLLSYVTWARYQRVIEGRIKFPEAKGFTASMEVGGALDVTSQLSNLLPSTKGDTTDKYLDFIVRNSSLSAGEDGADAGTRIVSETALEFTICVYSTGNLPLELRMVELDGDSPVGQIYTAWRTLAASDKTWGERYLYHFPVAAASGRGTVEQRFTLDAGEEKQRTFRIYFDWASGEDALSQPGDLQGQPADFVSEVYKKEVELMEIRSVVSAQPETPSYDTVPTVAVPGGN